MSADGEPSEDVPPGGERIVTYAADELGPGWLAIAALLLWGLLTLPFRIVKRLRRLV